jgi:hypothetical protein
MSLPGSVGNFPKNAFPESYSEPGRSFRAEPVGVVAGCRPDEPAS